MSRIFLILFILVLGGVGLWVFLNKSPNSIPEELKSIQETFQSLPETNKEDSEALKIVADSLDTPWAIAFLPSGGFLVTERSGNVQLFNVSDTKGKLITKIADVKEIGEGGLLGIALHPQFSTNSYAYFYYTYSASGDNTLNRVVRMTYQDNKFSNEEVILDNIPGASNHNGGRIKFGPDGFLYVGTGDAQEPSRSQDRNSLAGKILRITDTGQAAPGNPFANATYSYGHRNVQGLAWDSSGQLYATEHGRSGVQSGLDEINRITPGKNYGWPTIEGDKAQSGMETPLRHSGSTTWAPSGMAFLDGSLYFGGLRGQSLYKLPLSVGQDGEVISYLEKEYGRIRDVVMGPENMLYITTSNRDGRGSPTSNDDRIIQVDPQKLR